MASGPEDHSIPPAERRGFRLRRVFVISDLVVLWSVIALAAAGDLLRGFPVVTEEVIAVAILVFIWVPIGISVGLYHVTGRGAAAATVDEIGAVARVATVFAWLSLLVRAALAGRRPGPVSDGRSLDRLDRRGSDGPSRGPRLGPGPRLV